MGIVHTGESEYDKELAKWNTPKSRGGYGPDGYIEFPKMLYKAFLDETGKVRCMEPPPPVHLYLSMPEFLRAEAKADIFTRQCQITVKSKAEEERAMSDGWRLTPSDAVAHFEALQQAIANAAAEAHANVRRMSERARAEFAAADAATSDHVTDLVGAPKSRKNKKPQAKSGVLDA